MQARISTTAAASPGVTPAAAGPLSRLGPLVQGVVDWVLDQSPAEELHGQCCDRLRPSFLRQELEQALQRFRSQRVVMVDWRWDHRLGRADGYIWQGCQLQRFHWWRSNDRLELLPLLLCTAAPALRPLS